MDTPRTPAMYVASLWEEGQWAVVWRYSSGDRHYVAGYPDEASAITAAERMNRDNGE